MLGYYHEILKISLFLGTASRGIWIFRYYRLYRGDFLVVGMVYEMKKHKKCIFMYYLLLFQFTQDIFESFSRPRISTAEVVGDEGTLLILFHGNKVSEWSFSSFCHDYVLQFSVIYFFKDFKTKRRCHGS